MAQVYNWTEDEDEVAVDAVTVGIRSDTRILTIAGLQFGAREAVVYWPETAANGTPVPAALEGPMPVEKALRRAHALCARHAFKRVVIWVQHHELWDNRWGTLAPTQGL
jgi:hypothetical protein